MSATSILVSLPELLLRYAPCTLVCPHPDPAGRHSGATITVPAIVPHLEARHDASDAILRTAITHKRVFGQSE